MQTQANLSEEPSGELFVIQTEERLETVQVAAIATYSPCLMGVPTDETE